MHGLHHLRTRARVTQGLEPFPARTLSKRLLDHLMYGAALLAPVALLPQIIELYETQSAAGLSLITWVLLGLVNVLWCFYAVVHKDRQLFVAHSMLFLCNAAIVTGIFLY